MDLSQKKSTTRAGIVQEEQDDYFKEKMEEYRLFLERHPGYNDDGILLGDEMESNSEHDEIAQPKRKRSNSNHNTTKSNANVGSRFSQRLINNRNLVEKSASDQNRSNGRECKYCKLAFGCSRLYPYDALLRHYRSAKCGSNLINIEDVDVEDEDYLIPEPKSFVTNIGSGLALPVTVSRDVYRDLPNTTNDEEIITSTSDVFSVNDHFMDNDFVDEVEDIQEKEENKYIKFQKLLYEQIYGLDCLYVNTYDEMIDLIRTTYALKFQKKMLRNISIYKYWVENRLSDRGQLGFLEVVHKILEDFDIPRSAIPESLNGVKYKIFQKLKIYKYGKLQIDWPEGWHIDEMAFEINPIQVYLRDPIMLVAELFVNPEIMFKYKNDVHFRYYSGSIDGGGRENTYANLMSSIWCKNTENSVLQRSPMGNLLPIIFYSDGVQLGTNIHNNMTPLMCTLGNFSDDLIDQDISKCVIGYLPNLRDYKASIHQHIKRFYRSENAVLEQFRYFDLLVEREVWKEIIKCVNKYWNEGVNLHVLGYGSKLFFPCVAFFVGDEPQQRRQAGIQEGNCTHSCIYCTYSSKDGLYDERRHLPRNFEENKRLCTEGDKILSKKSLGNVVSRTEEKVLDNLKSRNVQPFSNPLFNAPLGYNSNVYIATPPDTSHLFCAGLMKSLTKTIMSIIHKVSQLNSNFRNNKALLDYRINNFPFVHDMPHVHWTTIKGGIMRYLGKTNQELGRSSGSFGGFRSNTFISLLFQLYYSIGNQGDVLPKEQTTKLMDSRSKKSIILCDIQGKVLKSISFLLDVYFDTKRAEWKDIEILRFERKLKNLYVHYIMVWDMNQTILAMNPNHGKKCQQRNPHKMLHLPMVLRLFGSLRKMDTSSWERYHKVATTGTWSQTSKRHDESSKEMLEKYNLNKFSAALTLISDMHTMSRQLLSTKMKIVVHDEIVRYDVMKNHKKLFFKIRRSRHPSKRCINVMGGNKAWKNACIHHPFHTKENFMRKLYDLEFFDLLRHYNNITTTQIKNYDMFIVGAIVYTSDPKSLGNGALYATSCISKLHRSRHDFVLLKVELSNNDLDSDDDISLGDERVRSRKTPEEKNYKTILVKILLFICIQENQLIPNVNNCDNVPIVFCLVQELFQVKRQLRSYYQLGTLFQWAADPRRNTSFLYRIIPVESILRPAFVVPVINNNYNANNPHINDKFFMLDRKYFDRSGWWTNNSFEGHEEFLNTLQEQQRYFDRNLREHVRLNRGIVTTRTSTSDAESGSEDNGDNEGSMIEDGDDDSDLY